MQETQATKQLTAEEDRKWVRDLIEEHGLTEEIQTEARHRIRRAGLHDIAVWMWVAVILWAIPALILSAHNAAWWTYFVAGAFAVAIAK